MIFYIESIGTIWLRNDQVCNSWWTFWELRRHFGLSLHILISFSLHFKMIWKKLQINTMIICTHGKKIKVFGAILSIPISTFTFQCMYKVLPNWTSFINLINNGILKNCAILLIFFYSKSYISLFSFQWCQSSKLFYANEELRLLQELVNKTKDIFKHP